MVVPTRIGALCRMSAAEEHCRRAGVVGAGVRSYAAGRWVCKIRYDADSIPELLERLKDLREPERLAFRRGGPFIHSGAVRERRCSSGGSSTQRRS